jgi:hypothetical protein
VRAREPTRAPSRLGALLRSPDAAYLAALTAIFAASRLVAYASGVRYAAGELAIAIQNLDPELLRHRLLQSVWFLHIQPPLWNLSLGAVLKLFPVHWAGAFHAIFTALGLVEVCALYLLATGLGLPRAGAAGLAAFFALSPDLVLYENWLFYDYPVLVLLTLAALAVQRYARAPTVAWASAFFALLAVVVLTRALYQLPWVLLAGALPLLHRVGRARTLLAAAVIPVGVLVALSVKQAVLFGTPTTTTWLGENLARIAIFTAPQSERERLVHEGRLSRIALVPTFSPLARYRGIVPRSPPRGIPALDEAWKSRHQEANFDNYGYVAVSHAYLEQALRQIRHRPGAYARGIKLAAERFLWPATYAGLQGPNTAKIARWRRVFDALYGSSRRANHVSFVLGLAYAVAAVFGLVVVVRDRRRETLAVSFMWLTLVYTALAGTLTDYGENYRLRLPVDPLAVVLVAVAGRRAAAALRPRAAASPEPR